MPNKHEITKEAKTVAEAIEQGLREMGVRRDQVEVTVLQEPSAGMFGFGAKAAKILLREKLWSQEGRRPEPDEEIDDNIGNRIDPPTRSAGAGRASSAPRQRDERPMREPRRDDRYGGGRSSGRGGNGRGRREGGRDRRESRPMTEPVTFPTGPYTPDVPKTVNENSTEAKAVIEELLKLLQVADATVLAGWDEAQGRVRAEIVSPEGRALVGRDGSVLEALQFLATLVVNRRLKAQVAVQVDVEGHWKRIEEKAMSSAQRGLEEVKKSGRSFRLEPMEAPLRRMIHKAFSESPDVETQSEGEGAYRKVVLKPRRK